eukprot:764477-Hanusia_phi.AAC.10
MVSRSSGISLMGSATTVSLMTKSAGCVWTTFMGKRRKRIECGCINTTEQMLNRCEWRFDPDGRLENKGSSLVLDVQNGNTEKGSLLWMYKKNDTPAQKWKYTENMELQCELNGLGFTSGHQRCKPQPRGDPTDVARKWTSCTEMEACAGGKEEVFVPHHAVTTRTGDGSARCCREDGGSASRVTCRCIPFLTVVSSNQLRDHSPRKASSAGLGQMCWAGRAGASLILSNKIR